MTARTNPELIERCRYLRAKKRMSLPEIMSATGLGRSTVHAYVKDLPLSSDELKERRKAIIADARSKIPVKEDDVPTNPLYELYCKNVVTKDQKGSFSEQAVATRAVLHGMQVFNPVVAGGKADFVLLNSKTGRLFKVQVKTAQKMKWGQPIAKLCARKGSGTSRYKASDFDAYILYDPRHDRFYIYLHEELTHLKSAVTVSKNHLERWDKLA